MEVDGAMGVVMVCVLAAVLVPAAIFDVRTRRIPNGLSLAGALIGLAMHVGYAGLDGALASLSGLGLALVIGFLFFAMGWLGAGDAKLLAAIGAIVGLSLTLEFLFWIALSGGLVAVAALALRGVLLGMLKRFWATLAISMATKRWSYIPPSDTETVEVPYAVSIALGSLIAVITGKVWLV